MNRRSPVARQVLLVEDDEGDCLLLSRILRGMDVTCDVVRDGDEAVEYLTATGRHSGRRAQGWPDLILLDLGLPGRSGHSVLRWLRWEAGVTQTPVVVLTGSSAPDDVRHAYRFGANSYLVKPGRLEELRRLAEALVEYWLGLNVPAEPRHA